MWIFLYLSLFLSGSTDHDVHLSKSDGNGSESGHVRVFKYQVISGTATWTQLGLDIDGEVI